MDLPLVRPLQPKSLPVTSQVASQIPQSKLAPLIPIVNSRPAKEQLESCGTLLSPPAPIVNTKLTRILDFDIETLSAGFDDPQWVPQKITCVAWNWIGANKVESRICTPLGIFGKPTLRREMLAELLEQIRAAEMLTGHNVERFDLPVINAECMRLGLDPIRTVFVQDTMRLVRSKGFKKGQDNILELAASALQRWSDGKPTPRPFAKKMALNWQQWQDAYDEDGWATVRDRCESDVIGHQQARSWLIEQGYLRSPRQWIGYR